MVWRFFLCIFFSRCWLIFFLITSRRIVADSLENDNEPVESGKLVATARQWFENRIKHGIKNNRKLIIAATIRHLFCSFFLRARGLHETRSIFTFVIWNV